MKQRLGPAIAILLLVIAAVIIWIKFSNPIDAQVNATFHGGVIQGTLVNNGSKTIDNAVIHATFRDGTGAQVGEGTAEFQSLAGGQSLPFRIVGPASAVSETHELKARSGGL
ncbi:MAG: FxLYD domain-containing protein [Chloroflexi bacterium]|nr:FxLYD domain-containing protein [Chloroflexota bacterium]